MKSFEGDGTKETGSTPESGKQIREKSVVQGWFQGETKGWRADVNPPKNAQMERRMPAFPIQHTTLTPNL
jgi:hypothetical protein